MNQFNPNNFPVQSLPPLIKNVVLEADTNTGFPIPLIVNSSLAALSASCQNQVDVELPYGSRSPVSLNFILVADSGEGKSPTDRMFNKPFRDFEAEQNKNSDQILAHYQADLTSWEIEKNALEFEIKKVKKLKVTASDSCRSAELVLREEKLQKQLKVHLSSKSISPLRYKIIQSNTTPGKLALDLSENVPTAYIFSDEGGTLLKGHLVKDLEMLNRAWDGSRIQVDRLNLPGINVESPRVTINVPVQPEVFTNYLNRRGKEARGGGWFARCLVACPYSTKGERFLSDRPQFTEHLNLFQNRITELLIQDEQELQQGRLERKLLKLSDEAKEYWYFFHNQLEYDLKPGGYLVDISDFASKITITLCRMAALFHYFEGYEGEISLLTIRAAGNVCNWYIGEFKRLFGKKPEIPLEVQDVYSLEQFLLRWSQTHPGNGYMLKSFITQYGPSSLRSNKGRREFAINALVMQGKIGIYVQGKAKLIGLHQSLFSQQYPSCPPLLPVY
ncbi:YfjI family protein [Methylotuvimicrobium sp. KM1]|uniref:YfjI family protein n=1 Tax=Methylotuvimicrobium sp. KM1 TaxID=3377707 RepID=UPI00385041B8